MVELKVISAEVHSKKCCDCVHQNYRALGKLSV